jgi:hypothetical protein
MMLKLAWIAIGLGILAAVGLTTYGLGALTHQHEVRSVWLVIERGKLVSHELAQLLDAVPKTGLARVSLIHGATPTTSGFSQLRVDQANTMVAPGRIVPVPVMNFPLSQWSGELDEFTAGICVMRRSGDLSNIDLKERLLPAGVLYYVGCPLIGDRGVLYGAVFLVWDNLDAVPPPEDMPAIVKRVQSAASIIGGYYQRMH